MRLGKGISLDGGVRAGPDMATLEENSNTGTGTQHNTSSFRETITPSRPSNNSVHNLDIESDIIYWPRLVTS
jgi:hypothetical protein